MSRERRYAPGFEPFSNPGPVRPPRPKPEPERLCIACVHFRVDFGDEAWSEMTPASSPSLTCAADVFSMIDGNTACNDAWPAILQTASGCASFCPRPREPVPYEYREKERGLVARGAPGQRWCVTYPDGATADYPSLEAVMLAYGGVWERPLP